MDYAVHQAAAALLEQGSAGVAAAEGGAIAPVSPSGEGAGLADLIMDLPTLAKTKWRRLKKRQPR